MAKETNLPIKSSFSNTTDYVRMTVGGISSVVTPTTLASGITSALSSLSSAVKVRETSTSGAIAITDNVVLANTGGTSYSLPNPSTAYDSSAQKSSVFTIVHSGSSGSVTITPYSSESIYDGGAQSSIVLGAGSALAVVTNGVNYFRIYS